MEKEPLLKTIFRRLKKRVSGKTLLILIVTLSANTFAWFIYANKVQSGIEATVKAWNITFELDSGQITEYITIDVDELYPGKTFSKNITIYNRGDTDADLSYQISSITLFGVTTTYTEAQNANPASLLSTIQANYPFALSLAFSNPVLAAGADETFTVGINWPYESGNDARDTSWGTQAYTYHSSNPNSPSMQMQIKIIATQRRVEEPVTPEP